MNISCCSYYNSVRCRPSRDPCSPCPPTSCVSVCRPCDYICEPCPERKRSFKLSDFPSSSGGVSADGRGRRGSAGGKERSGRVDSGRSSSRGRGSSSKRGRKSGRRSGSERGAASGSDSEGYGPGGRVGTGGGTGGGSRGSGGGPGGTSAGPGGGSGGVAGSGGGAGGPVGGFGGPGGGPGGVGGLGGGPGGVGGPGGGPGGVGGPGGGFGGPAGSVGGPGSRQAGSFGGPGFGGAGLGYGSGGMSGRGMLPPCARIISPSVPSYGGGIPPCVPSYGGGIPPSVPSYGGGIPPSVPSYGGGMFPPSGTPRYESSRPVLPSFNRNAGVTYGNGGSTPRYAPSCAPRNSSIMGVEYNRSPGITSGYRSNYYSKQSSGYNTVLPNLSSGFNPSICTQSSIYNTPLFQSSYVQGGNYLPGNMYSYGPTGNPNIMPGISGNMCSYGPTGNPNIMPEISGNMCSCGPTRNPNIMPEMSGMQTRCPPCYPNIRNPSFNMLGSGNNNLYRNQIGQPFKVCGTCGTVNRAYRPNEHRAQSFYPAVERDEYGNCVRPESCSAQRRSNIFFCSPARRR